MTVRTLDDVFTFLRTNEPDPAAIYTALTPVYETIYATRDRADGQFETVVRSIPLDTTAVLEVGCGTGALLARLGDAFDRTVGADVSPGMVHRTRDRTGAGVVIGSVDAFLPGSFDAVVMMGAVLGHVRPDAAARTMLNETRDRLRSGGRFVCGVHDRSALADPTSRELTAKTADYCVLQRDRQRPIGGGVFEWTVEYVLTSRETGESVSVEQRVPIRAFGRDELAEWFRAAGFRDVRTDDRTFVKEERRSRAFVITATAGPSDRAR